MPRDYSKQSGSRHEANLLLASTQDRFCEGQSSLVALGEREKAFCEGIMSAVREHWSAVYPLYLSAHQNQHDGAGDATRLQEVFRRLDTNNDGVLTLAEFTEGTQMI
jgi:hypothetical protein